MKENDSDGPDARGPLQMKKINLPGVGSIDPTTILIALITVAIWGSAFVGIRVGIKAYSPGSLALLRYLVASLVLAGYAIARKMPLQT